MSITVFSSEYLNSLVSQAAESPRLRQHRNIHIDYSDPCQRLFNAIEPGSYICPHKHGLVPRSETMIAIRGLMALVVFDDSGQVDSIHRFGAGSHSNMAAVAAGVETAADTWHTVVALEPGSVLLELKGGPFDPHQPKEQALWAPAEGTEEAAVYLGELERLVRANG